MTFHIITSDKPARLSACPPHQLVWESNGHDYIAAPDPTGKSCYTPMELPITVPPTVHA